jgi:hypothetical protein
MKLHYSELNITAEPLASTQLISKLVIAQASGPVHLHTVLATCFPKICLTN